MYSHAHSIRSRHALQQVFDILFDLQTSYRRRLSSINVCHIFRLDSNRWNHSRPCFYYSKRTPSHNHGRSSRSLNSLPNCIEYILILTITHFDSIAHKSPIFRPLEAYARLAYTLTTIGEALRNRTLLNQSLSLVTFKRHHIHSTTTLHALTNWYLFDLRPICRTTPRRALDRSPVRSPAYSYDLQSIPFALPFPSITNQSNPSISSRKRRIRTFHTL
jgi:hypothetical protein